MNVFLCSFPAFFLRFLKFCFFGRKNIQMWILVIGASVSYCASLVFAIFILFENIVSLQKILREDEKTFRSFCPQRRQNNWAGGKQGRRWHWRRSDAVTGAANASPALGERGGEGGTRERGGLVCGECSQGAAPSRPLPPAARSQQYSLSCSTSLSPFLQLCGVLKLTDSWMVIISSPDGQQTLLALVK